MDPMGDDNQPRLLLTNNHGFIFMVNLGKYTSPMDGNDGMGKIIFLI